MTSKTHSPDDLLYAIFESVPVNDPRPIYEWLEENVQVGTEMSEPGPFNIERHPYLKEPFDLLKNQRGIEVTVVASVQSAKSLLGQGFIAWAIKYRPGPMQWNFQTDPKAKDFAEKRLMPMLRACSPLKNFFPSDRHKDRTTEIIFTHMFLKVQGANSEGNLQTFSIMTQINDEVFLYPPGHLEQLRKRVSSFKETHSHLILNLSTGGDEGSEIAAAWEESDQRELEVSCPSCKKYFSFKWDKDPNKFGGMIWDDNEITRGEDGNWNIREVRKTVAYECPHCGERVPWSRQNRSALLKTWKFNPKNSNASEDKIGFRWNAFVHVNWPDLVEEWLKAVSALRRGDPTLIREFRTKRLAETYSQFYEDFKIDIRKSGYRKGQLWENECWIDHKGRPIVPCDNEKLKLCGCRLITVDVQHDCFYIIVRSFSVDGSSRGLWEERVHTWQEIELLQDKFEILPSLVFIDAGDQTNTVFTECSKRGWTALIGDRRATWAHKLQGQKKPVFRYYSPLRKIQLGVRVCRQFYWSNLNVKDVLDKIRRNQDPSQGITWQIADDYSDVYLESMDSEVKKKIKGEWIWVQKGKRPNHFWDCEAMATAAAIMLRLIGKETITEENEEGEKESES